MKRIDTVIITPSKDIFCFVGDYVKDTDGYILITRIVDVTRSDDANMYYVEGDLISVNEHREIVIDKILK